MIRLWHTMLDMKKYDRAWHEQDIADELSEYHEETRFLKKWSELSDVSYTYSRAKWSGHTLEFPFSKWHLVAGVMYMIPKYTGRWLFFKKAGKRAGSKEPIREVRNPRKVHKLHTIAKRYDIDTEAFQEICEQQLKRWILLP